MKVRLDIGCFLGNAIVAHLYRSVDMEGIPAAGMQIAFGLNHSLATDDAKRRYSLLVSESPNSSGVVTVQQVTYFPDGDPKGHQVQLACEPMISKDDRPLRAYIDLMSTFYGFKEDPL